jgi:hypothetical protein
MATKSWRQKLEEAPAAHVSVLDKPFSGLPVGTRLLIATPMIVRDFMKTVPAGKTVSIAEMRRALAERHGAGASCPLTTSIFARIAAEAALDDYNAGLPLSEMTPFWRVIDEKSPIASKLSCGVAFIAEQRARERQTQ